MKDGPGAEVTVGDTFLWIQIWKAKDASFALKGKLIFGSHFGRRDRVLTKLDSKASLTIAGDFVVGNGGEIWVAEGGAIAHRRSMA